MTGLWSLPSLFTKSSSKQSHIYSLAFFLGTNAKSTFTGSLIPYYDMN